MKYYHGTTMGKLGKMIERENDFNSPLDGFIEGWFTTDKSTAFKYADFWADEAYTDDPVVLVYRTNDSLLVNIDTWIKNTMYKLIMYLPFSYYLEERLSVSVWEKGVYNTMILNDKPLRCFEIDKGKVTNRVLA